MKYNGDIDATEGIPQRVTEFRKAFIDSVGVLFAPKYDNLMPGVLNKPVDWLTGLASTISSGITRVCPNVTRAPASRWFGHIYG